jgi:hypothetical protein
MMKVTLKNSAGLIREVPTGLSWTGFFFTGFVLLYRGMFARGLVYLILIYGFQITWMMVGMSAAFVEALEGGDGSASGGFMMMGFILLMIPNVIFLFKVNKWTTRYWLDRGYQPVGDGWDEWAPKVGISVNA